jgi:hypothetical protein
MHLFDLYYSIQPRFPPRQESQLDHRRVFSPAGQAFFLSLDDDAVIALHHSTYAASKRLSGSRASAGQL